jgi:hypothetical protein
MILLYLYFTFSDCNYKTQTRPTHIISIGKQLSIWNSLVSPPERGLNSMLTKPFYADFLYLDRTGNISC